MSVDGSGILGASTSSVRDVSFPIFLQHGFELSNMNPSISSVSKAVQVSMNSRPVKFEFWEAVQSMLLIILPLHKKINSFDTLLIVWSQY